MISIITSLYKSDRYLDTYSKNLLAFAQELEQAGVPFEVIVIPNDPTMREQQFGEEFKNKSWFRYYPVGRESLYATWNRGVSLAQGSAITFWNCDDVRFPAAVTEGLKLMSQGAELVYFPFYIMWYMRVLGISFLIRKKLIQKNLPVYSALTRPEFQRSMFCGPFFMFTKELYQKVGPFDEQFKIAGDFDWCVRAAKASEKFVLATEPAGKFRVDGSGLSSGYTSRLAVEDEVVIRRHQIAGKSKKVDDSLMKTYHVGARLQGTEYIPL